MDSKNKKALIITYYWPPDGNVGAQRWVKFVKHLRTFNWEPIVVTAKGQLLTVEDQSLHEDIPSDINVLRVPIWEPYKIYKRFIGIAADKVMYSGLMSTQRSSFLQRLALWIRANIFVPDARVMWVTPCVKYIKKWIKSNPVDLIITTGTPQSVHLIGLKLKKVLNCPWVTDFRDPWTEINYYEKVRPISMIHNWNQNLEKKVLDNSDLITTVSPTWALNFSKKTDTPIETITNGYDESDFGTSVEVSDSRFSICHVGFMSKDRNCRQLWKVLSNMTYKDNNFSNDLVLEFYGPIDSDVYDGINDCGLSDHAIVHDYVRHSRIASVMRSKSVLLLSIGNVENSQGWIPSKVFEYMAAKRPILSIGDVSGDCNEILSSNGYYPVMSYDDEENLKDRIREMYKKYKEGTLTAPSNNITGYERKELTRRMCNQLDKLVVES